MLGGGVIDFIQELHGLLINGFDVGYFTAEGFGHLLFYLLRSKEVKAVISVCFHDKTKPRYALKLLVDNKPVYEGKAEDKQEMEKIVNELISRADEYDAGNEVKE